MSIFHPAHHETDPAVHTANAPASPVADAILIEHVLGDPEVTPILETTFGPELTAITLEVAKAQRLKTVDDAKPEEKRGVEEFRQRGLLAEYTPQPTNEPTVFDTAAADSIENMKDALVAPITAAVAPRRFTHEESKVVDKALELVAAFGRDSRGRVTDADYAKEADSHRIGTDANVLLSGSSEREGYVAEASDLLARRIAEQSLRGRVATVLSNMPHFLKSA